MTQPTPNATDWYTHSFGELYPILYAHRDDTSARAEVAALIDLVGLKPPARVLDICCGAGRHLQTLLDLGFDAHGVDLSEHLLRLAEGRPGLAGRVTHADVRNLPFEGEFDAAVNLFTSFGYFPTDEENEAALGQMVKTLRTGGVLVMDLVNRAWLERVFEPTDNFTTENPRLTVEIRRRLVGDRAEKDTVATDEQGNARTFFESVRLFKPDEMHAMLERAGVGDLRFFGSHEGIELAPDAPRMIVTGVKR
ncbi:MAG: class I SAM-dependent methyltransferase [Planctomycetota bacterium]